MEDLRVAPWHLLAQWFRDQAAARGLSQERLAAEAGVALKSVNNALNPNVRPSRVGPAAKSLAIYFGRAYDEDSAKAFILRFLRNGGLPVSEQDEGAPMPMARAVKEEWRRQVQASDMSAGAKREALELIESIPDAD